MRFNHIWLTKMASRENQLKNVGQTNLRMNPFFRCLFIICGHQKINGSCKTDYITPKNKRNPPAELYKFGLTSLEINCLATLIHWGIKVIAPTHTFYIQPYLFNVFVCVNHSRVHRTTECPLVVCVSNRQVFCLLISEFPPINWVYYDGISSRFVARSQLEPFFKRTVSMSENGRWVNSFVEFWSRLRFPVNNPHRCHRSLCSHQKS